MLPGAVEPFLDQQFDRPRVNREVAHGRCKKILLLTSDRMQDMFDRDIVLIAPTRLVQGGLEDTPAAVAEFVFISVYICHCFSSGLLDAGGEGFVPGIHSNTLRTT